MLMLRTIYIFFGLLLAAQLVAQPLKGLERRPALATIQMLKENYFNKELNLTEAEKESFWPVYNKYFVELRKAKQQSTDDVLDFEEKVITTRKTYLQEFKRILNSEEKAKKVFVLDKNFSAFIKKELLERQRKRQENAIKKAPTIEN